MFVLSGASGLIGKGLVTSLQADGHEVRILVRRQTRSTAGPGPIEVSWDPAKGELDPAQVEGCRFFVNLSGAPIGDQRWSHSRKEELLRSRVDTTRLIARTVATVAGNDGVLLNASAVGYYGDRANEELTEQSASGAGFLPDLCRQWEQATEPAQGAGVRVVNLRSGIVIAGQGGALGKQLRLFRLGLGGRLGAGRQWVSWITIEDEIGAIRYALSEPSLSGPVNSVAPGAVTNAELTKQLARALHRPALLTVPPAALRIAFGTGLANELILASQRVLPTKLSSSGFVFTSPDLRSALDRTLS
jgi:uncharacterized protein (TIGR01777 family)